ncbi:MAG: AGZA family xanthine/uracil permease-like MFS transporter [Mariniblastus sp.]|jgi:AGZA family xanthine/uracil permease-like MFS transporter
MSNDRYLWARSGDVNAFFGLMLDNIAGMVLMVGLLASVFSFPVEFALRYMVPGTAIGVLVGDLLYTWLAFAHAKKTGNTQVTAMPLGLDTPSTIGMVFLVLGPAFRNKFKALAESASWQVDQLREAAVSNADALEVLKQVEFDAATYAWHIGICSIFFSGIIKFGFSFCSSWIRTAVPRAGLLGSLAAIALVLITFSPLEKVSANPIVGFTALIFVVITLLGRNKLGKMPVALGAVLAGCFVWYAMVGIDKLGLDVITSEETKATIAWFPKEWLTVFSFAWLGVLGDAVTFLPYVFPFAIATVIGGIDCTESAASAGDDFNTNSVIGIEAFSTLVASLCGGVIQSTPYIGHPAYKTMGGRAAYTLATALFIGGAGLIGYFGLLFQYIPEAAVMPILIFIGIEITAQSFHVTPRRHYAAIAIACLPALVKLVVIYLEQFVPYETFMSDVRIANLKVLAGGFIITSLIWASVMAKVIDRRFISASVYMAVGGVMILFGVIHSPIDKMYWPTDIGSFSPENQKVLIEYVIAYLLMAVILYAYGIATQGKVAVINTDEEFEALQD